MPAPARPTDRHLTSNVGILIGTGGLAAPGPFEFGGATGIVDGPSTPLDVGKELDGRDPTLFAGHSLPVLIVSMTRVVVRSEALTSFTPRSAPDVLDLGAFIGHCSPETRGTAVWRKCWELWASYAQLARNCWTAAPKSAKSGASSQPCGDTPVDEPPREWVASAVEDGPADEGVDATYVGVLGQLDLDVTGAGPHLDLGVPVEEPAAFSDDHMLMEL